jgi:Methyltransferase domain
LSSKPDISSGLEVKQLRRGSSSGQVRSPRIGRGMIRRADAGVGVVRVLLVVGGVVRLHGGNPDRLNARDGGHVFGEDYPRFIEASELTPTRHPHAQSQRQRLRDAAEQQNRMNERYEALFASNRDIFDGARVLDLASHDGRYSFAALKTGAAHVTGVEVRESLVDKARETFSFYGQDPKTYRFVCGDVFEVLAREQFDVDVVLCLGYLYHTYRHTELMYRLHHLAPRHLIVDTMVVPGRQSNLRVIREWNSDDIRQAAQDAYSVDRVLVARPTVPALQKLLSAYGFEIESMYDWKGRLADRPPMPGLRGYANGKRVTLRCRSREAAVAAGWGPVAPLPASAGAPSRMRGRKRTPTPPPAQQAGGWRARVNKALARVTGYELRRASTKS